MSSKTFFQVKVKPVVPVESKLARIEDRNNARENRPRYWRIDVIRKQKLPGLFGAVLMLMLQPNEVLADLTFVEEPAVTSNPNKSVPLSAIVSFVASEPVTTTIAVSDERRTWKLSYSEEDDPSIGLPVVGLKYGESHRISVEIENGAGERLSGAAPLTFKTPDKPSDLTLIPPVRVMKRVQEKMEPGLTVASLRRSVTNPGDRRRSSGGKFWIAGGLRFRGRDRLELLLRRSNQ